MSKYPKVPKGPPKKKKLSELNEGLKVLVAQCGYCPYVELTEAEPNMAGSKTVPPTEDPGATQAALANQQAAPEDLSAQPDANLSQEDPNAEQPEASPTIQQPGQGTDFTPKTQEEQQDQGACNCKSCPTFARGAAQAQPVEATYCHAGTSNLTPVARGCLCPSCPVYKNHAFLGWYYCLTSKAERVTDMMGTGAPEQAGFQPEQGDQNQNLVPDVAPTGVQPNIGQAAPAVGKTPPPS